MRREPQTAACGARRQLGGLICGYCSLLWPLAAGGMGSLRLRLFLALLPTLPLARVRECGEGEKANQTVARSSCMRHPAGCDDWRAFMFAVAAALVLSLCPWRFLSKCTVPSMLCR
uniref:Uncharacterized protein n=1 Tax=Strombidinopsis acuminata TaxID=141414 RepID=A0A7S3W7N4_9SPIT|mmetsp:Transcript_8038/g.25050  ORF Transcript_8038/g.25050 Transcript_8038/m.25050 type:complete len:116 (+) Transcript_8038:227-574(+)